MTIATQVAMKTWPAPIKRQIKDTCGGDWDRVVVSDNGAITVYNNSSLAARARAREDAPAPTAAAPAPVETTAAAPAPTRPVPRPSQQPQPVLEQPPVSAPPAPATEVDEPEIDELADYVAPDVDDDEPAAPRPRKTILEALAEKQQPGRGPALPGLGADSQAALDRLRAHVAKQHEPTPGPPAPSPEPKVEYVPAEKKRPRREALRRDGDGSDFDTRILIEQAQSNTGMVEYLKAGLPAGAAYLYFPDVVDLYGIDFDLVDAVVRNPQEVTLRPETTAKGYPVIRFARGDVEVIMGFRDPQLPMAIAVYHLSRLDREGLKYGSHDHSRPPATGSALLRHLRGMGAMVHSEPSKPTARIVYKDQDLGQVSTHDHDREVVRRDFERISRKIRGVDAAAQKETESAE